MKNPFRKLPSVGRFASTHKKLALGVASVAMLAVGTGIGVGVADATTASPTTTTTTTAPPSSHKGASKHHTSSVRGQIVSIKGNVWTIKTSKGKTYTVDIGSTTNFGTTAKPLQESGLKTGESITVTGHRKGTNVTATRVTLTKTKPSSSTHKTTTSSTTL